MTLKDRILKYHKGNSRWVPSGETQRLVVEHTKYTPRTAVRRLQELAEAGLLEVKYEKGHAYYRAKRIPVTDAEWEGVYNSL